jgi:hypothetical protein
MRRTDEGFSGQTIGTMQVRTPSEKSEHRGPAVAERCVCARCGAHVVCTVGLATVGGICGVCGGTELTPLVGGNGRSSRRFAVASVAEVDMMSDSGYGGIVLDRLAKQTAGVLAVEQSCIFARTSSHKRSSGITSRPRRASLAWCGWRT